MTADERVRLLEHTFAVDVLTDARGAACGVLVAGPDGTQELPARAVVLASGGIGQVYRSTTNPPEATGDGVAAALRAGAVLADLEFVQFHPTVLWLGGGARGQQPLISEALRGEGAVLLDEGGHRFMPDLDPRGELAPRDVVARGIVDRMGLTGSDHVLLDARHLGAEFLARRFPSIVRRLAEHGFDLAADPVPVAPAQHYHSGGVRTDLRRPLERRRPVRGRRDGLHGRARRQPAGQQLPARGPRLRRPAGRRHRGAARRRGAVARCRRRAVRARPVWCPRPRAPGSSARRRRGPACCATPTACARPAWPWPTSSPTPTTTTR